MRLQHLKHLDDALEAFAACASADMLLSTLFAHIRDLFHMEAAFVWLATHGGSSRLYRTEGVGAPVAARLQRLKISAHGERTIARRLHKLGYRAVLAAPLGVQGKMVGLMAAGSQRFRRLSRTEAAMFRLLIRSAANALERLPAPPTCADDEARWPATTNTALNVQHVRTHLLNVLTSGLIHDLNNAMAVISGRVELLLHSLHDRALLRHLMEAQHATLEACETIRHMHGFVSSGREGGLGLFDINQLVRDSLQIARSSWFQDFCQRRVPVDLREDLQPVPALSGRASDLRMALLCLLRHAMDTLRPGGRLMVRTSAVGEAAGRFVLVSLAADPYPPETVEHEDGIGILLRQTLTPESRLVLEFAQAIIYDLEGQIMVDRSGDGATATTLTFPVGRTIAGVH